MGNGLAMSEPLRFASRWTALFTVLMLPLAGLAQAPAPTDGPEADLAALLIGLRAKMTAEGATAEALAPELAGFDALLAKYEGNPSGAVADIAMMKVVFISQVLKDEDRALALLPAIAESYPGTEAAAYVPQFVANLERARAARVAEQALVGQPAPALHFDWASRDGLTSLEDLKGKVVVIDFWATWCGPCISSFPNVRELVDHYAGAPVEVIGVTSLQGRVHGLEAEPIMVRSEPEREYELTARFAREYDMNWTVAFSREEVFNPDYSVTGIPHMTIIAPDGTVRHSGLHPAMPHAEKVDMIDAILAEFVLTDTPAAD